MGAMLRPGAAMAALSLPCFVVAYLTRGVAITAAYLDGPGDGNLQGPILAEGVGFFEGIDLGDGYMWFGAGGALLVAGLLLAAVGLALRRRRPSRAWQVGLPGALALACFALAAIKDGPHLEVVKEDEGWTSYGPLGDVKLRFVDLWEPSDPYMWFGGGVALLVVTLATAAHGVARARR